MKQQGRKYVLAVFLKSLRIGAADVIFVLCSKTVYGDATPVQNHATQIFSIQSKYFPGMTDNYHKIEGEQYHAITTTTEFCYVIDAAFFLI
jgi:hypothetical protein